MKNNMNLLGSNKKYASSLEEYIEELETKLEECMEVSKTDRDMLTIVRAFYTRQQHLPYDVMKDVYDATNMSMKEKIIRKIYRIKEWFSEHKTDIFFSLLLIVVVGGMVTLMIATLVSEHHGREMSVKIDTALRFDVNGDSVITDDERQSQILKFIKQHNLMVYESDFYDCVRKREYTNFYRNGEKIDIDEVYKLAAPLEKP
jgi:hypothetical protein